MKILGHPLKEWTRPADLAAGVFAFFLVFGGGPAIATVGDALLRDLGAALFHIITGVRQ